MTKPVESISIGIKLDGKNFPVWSKLMRVNIGSREKLDHLEGEKDPPKPEDPKFQEWQTADFTVFSWLIQNMEERLVVQFAQHQTAKAMWRSLATTFGVRADPVQVYDLDLRLDRCSQGGDSLEAYWSELQNLWVAMDSRKPCPYQCCDEAVKTYRKETEVKRLYQFLRGLDDRYDALRREILKERPEPTAEDALSIVKQEEGRIGVWKPTPDSGIGAGFGARTGAPLQFNRQSRPPPTPPSRGQQQPLPPHRNNPSNRRTVDKSKLFCTVCGMTKHTKETCFQVIGYPEWWEDGHKLNRNQTAKGRSAIGREGDEGGDRLIAPAGNHETAGAEVDGGRPADAPAAAGSWWATGQAEGKKDEAAKAHFAQFGGYPDGDDHWAWH